jgi:4-amino-4-deoxy-L-arabinose transferase-like glycosyltransferase
MGKPWESLLQAWDSSLHARVALQTASGGVLPVLPMRSLNLDDPAGGVFNDHPFTLFYMVGKFMRFAGADAWSARFIPSLFSVLAILILYRLVKAQFSHGVAVIASLLFLLCPMWFQTAARFQLDPAMIFFILLSFLFWRKGDFSGPRRSDAGFAVAAGLAAGFAVAMKSPVGFLILPVAFIVEFILGRKRGLPFWRGFMLLTVSSISVPVMIWSITGWVGGWHLVYDYFSRQVLGTAVHGRGYGTGLDPFYFFRILKQSFILGNVAIILLVISWLRLPSKSEFFRGLKTYFFLNRDLQLNAMAFLVGSTVIAQVRFKYPYYFLSVLPFLSIIIGVLVSRTLESFGKDLSGAWLDRFLIPLVAVVPLILVVFPISLTAESYPALRKFMPFIQAYSKPQDRVLFVDHLQPYRSGGDYYVEVVFYTNRRYLTAMCRDASERVRTLKPEWVITSGIMASDCIQLSLLANYPFRLKAGNQFLLSRNDVARTEGVMDLTPLYLELKATVDEVPPSLPRNQFYRY